MESACGLTGRLPEAAEAAPPVTSEREIRAGTISDVPYICNNGRGRPPTADFPATLFLPRAWSAVGQTVCGPGAVVLWQSIGPMLQPGERGAVMLGRLRQQPGAF